MGSQFLHGEAHLAPPVGVLPGASGQVLLVQFLGKILLVDGQKLRRRLRQKPEDRMVQFAGELAALVPDLGETSASPPADLVPDGRRIARAIVETFLALSRDRPLALLVDDLHDADRPTAEVAAQILAAPRASRLLVVLSFRDTDLARSPLLQRITSNVRALSGSTEISLSGFDEEGVAQLARSLRQKDVPASEVSRLHSRTNGNPFFVAHLVGGGDSFADSVLPQRVHDLIWQEVERLGPDAQACLSVASVAGGDFDLSTVARVAGYDDDRALDALDEAVLAKMLVELPSGVGQYQFRHDLLRESIYQRLTATRRAHLHRRLADDLTARRASGQAQSLIPVVEHLREARDLVPPAVRRPPHPHRVARDRSPTRPARSARCDDLIGDRSADRRARTLTALGHVARRSGQLDRARSAFVQAHALASELEDEQLQVAATVGLCALPFVPGDRPADPDMIAMLEGALDLGPSREPGVRSQLLARLALEAFYDPARPRPDSLAEEAVAVAERSEDPRALAAALAVGHLAFRGPDGSERRLELARRLANRAGAAGQPELVVSALLGQTVAEVECGNLGALEAGAREVIELARALRQPAYTWWAYLWKATEAIAAGELAEGEALSARAYEIGHVTFGSSAELELQAQRAWIALEQDRFVELREALSAAESAFAALPVWQSLKARVLVATGGEELAAQSVAELTGRGLAMLERDTNWLISATLLAETAAQAGDTTTAEELFRRLRPRAHHWAVSARGTVCLGPVAAALALLGTVLGHVDEAERFYAVAQERCLASGAESAARRLQRQYRARVGADRG